VKVLLVNVITTRPECSGLAKTVEVTGIVEPDDARTAGADIDFGDRRNAVPEAPELRKLDSQDGREKRQNNEVVSDDAETFVLMLDSERFNGIDGAALDIDKALSPRHAKGGAVRAAPVLRQFRKLFAEFLERQALHFPDAHLDDAVLDEDLFAVSSGDARGGINGAGERAGVDRGERYPGECFPQTFCLATAGLVERGVRTAEREATAVILRFTVADEEDTRSHARVSPDRR